MRAFRVYVPAFLIMGAVRSPQQARVFVWCKVKTHIARCNRL